MADVIVRSHPERGRSRTFEGVSNAALMGETVDKARLLALKEIELAKAEAKAEIDASVRMAAGLGVAGVCLIMTLTLFLVAAGLALGLTALPDWGAVLIAAGVPLLIGAVAGAVGWASRVKKPMAVTRRSLREDLKWARDVI